VARTTRKTNEELVEELVRLLSNEFPAEALEVTKPVRSKMWVALREIRRRMCPQPEDFKGEGD
jgi:hypothetical protein